MFLNALLFVLSVIALLTGLFFCICAGYLLERIKGSVPLYAHRINLALFSIIGGLMVGTAGGKLGPLAGQAVSKENSFWSFLIPALLVIGASACAGLGMWIAHKENHRSNLE